MEDKSPVAKLRKPQKKGTPRMNVQDVAEVLLRELNKVELLAKRMEELAQKTIKVDETPLHRFSETQEHNIERENAILSDFKRLSKKNRSLIPLWSYLVLAGAFLLLYLSFQYNIAQYNEIKELKAWKSKAMEYIEQTKK